MKPILGFYGRQINITKEYTNYAKRRKYVKYIDDNIEDVANYVNNCFENSKESLKEKLINEIREYLEPLPIHYVLKPDDNPYDHSGVLVEDGYISLDQTIEEFLENEYTGTKRASYISGMGWIYDDYGEELSYYTLDLAADIYFPAMRKYLEDKFSVSLSEEEFDKIRVLCGDLVYDNSIASDFFFTECAIKYVGIENLKLTDIIKK